MGDGLFSAASPEITGRGKPETQTNVRWPEARAKDAEEFYWKIFQRSVSVKS